MKHEIYECAFLMPLPTVVADFFFFDSPKTFVATAVVVSCITHRGMKIILQKYANSYFVSMFSSYFVYSNLKFLSGRFLADDY